MGFVYISMVKFKVTDLDNLGFCPTRVRENTWPALRHGDVVFVVRTLRLAALKVAVINIDQHKTTLFIWWFIGRCIMI